MGIIAKEPEGNFTPAPEDLHKAVCCDVVDGITRETKWGTKEKVAIYWETEAVNPETNKRYIVRKEYTISLATRSNLRSDLESWRGRRFTEDELKGFDLEKLIGANAQMQVIHETTPDGKTYGNVSALLPLPKTESRLSVSKEYIRVKDRKKEPGNNSEPTGSGNTEF